MTFLRVFLGAALLLTTPTFTALADPPNGIRAVVHDAVITSDEVDIGIQTAAVRLSDQTRNQPELFQNKLNELRTAKLQELLDRQLILHEFKTANYNLPESIIDELVQEEIRLQYRDRVTATKSIEEQGLTQEKFRQLVRDRFVVNALRQKNISSPIIISPHKIESYYAAHKDEFKVEDEVKLRMIVLTNSVERSKLATRKAADEIAAKLKEGASFEEMIVYSERPQRSAGAEWFRTSGLRKELAEAVTKLKAGERSEVVETPEACYLISVEETRPTHIKPLSEVREQIEKDLRSQESARLEKQWIERLKKKTFVQIFP